VASKVVANIREECLCFAFGHHSANHHYTGSTKSLPSFFGNGSGYDVFELNDRDDLAEELGGG
jgi:hypothetical protein